MKGIPKNLFYLMSSTIIGRVVVNSNISSIDDGTSWLAQDVRTCWIRCFTSLVKQCLLKGVKTRKLEFYEHYIIEKQNKVMFDITVHQTKAILYYVYKDT